MGFRGIAIKAGVATLESQQHFTDRAIALFADDDFGDAFFGGVGIVDFIAVNKAN